MGAEQGQATLHLPNLDTKLEARQLRYVTTRLRVVYIAVLNCNVAAGSADGSAECTSHALQFACSRNIAL